MAAGARVPVALPRRSPDRAMRHRVTAERELKELERDLRTVFCYQLHPKLKLKEMFAFFSQAGQVTDVSWPLSPTFRRPSRREIL